MSNSALPSELTDLHNQLLNQINTVHSTTASLLHTQESELINYFQSYTKRLNDSYNHTNTHTQLTNEELLMKYNRLNDLCSELTLSYSALQQAQCNTTDELYHCKCELELVQSDKTMILKESVKLKHTNQYYLQLLHQHNIDHTLPHDIAHTSYNRNTSNNNTLVNNKPLYNRPGTAKILQLQHTPSIHRPHTAAPNTHNIAPTKPNDNNNSNNDVNQLKHSINECNTQIDKLNKRITTLNDKLQNEKADKLRLANMIHQSSVQYNKLHNNQLNENITQFSSMSIEQRQYVLSQLSINSQFWLYMQHVVDSAITRNNTSSDGIRPNTSFTQHHIT